MSNAKIFWLNALLLIITIIVVDAIFDLTPSNGIWHGMGLAVVLEIYFHIRKDIPEPKNT